MAAQRARSLRGTVSPGSLPARGGLRRRRPHVQRGHRRLYTPAGRRTRARRSAPAQDARAGARRPGAAALKQYDECASALMDELGVPPSAETNALYDRILAGDFDQVTAAPEAAPSPFQAIAAPGIHWPPREVARVVAMLTQPGRAAVVAVVGMGGVGKTALAAAVANDLRSAFPDGILWGRVATDEPMDILQSWAVAYDRDLSKIASPAARRRDAQPARRQTRADRARRRRGRPAD
ncbi:MAG: hypothetical protein H6640_23510 [Caldilineaceae bacterium]|nr:hypothetical protein [Caldilineaceae bacterium]